MRALSLLVAPAWAACHLVTPYKPSEQPTADTVVTVGYDGAPNHAADGEPGERGDAQSSDARFVSPFDGAPFDSAPPDAAPSDSLAQPTPDGPAAQGAVCGAEVTDLSASEPPSPSVAVMGWVQVYAPVYHASVEFAIVGGDATPNWVVGSFLGNVLVLFRYRAIDVPLVGEPPYRLLARGLDLEGAPIALYECIP